MRAPDASLGGLQGFQSVERAIDHGIEGIDERLGERLDAVEGTWRNWCRREGSFALQKGEVRVRESSPEQKVREQARVQAFDEYIRLSRLPENLKKTEAEIWAMLIGGVQMKKLKQFLSERWTPVLAVPCSAILMALAIYSNHAERCSYFRCRQYRSQPCSIGFVAVTGWLTASRKW